MSTLLRPAVGISTLTLGLALLHYALKRRSCIKHLRHALDSAADELEKEKAKRQSERKGRIHAEKELRALAVQQSTQQHPQQQTSTVFPFKAIGTIHSCFNQRNGTPRQPLLVPAARSCLKLAPDIPPSCLEGLQGFSHCWVLYVFHCNTDLAKALGPNRSAVKGKVNVPRLDGGRCGVLATRTPHRPCPIGLSTARILGVEGDRLLLGGADIVDGSPVLDIKPYLPFCDSVPGATAPPWVKEEAQEEPLRVGGVAISEAAQQLLHGCWDARRGASLYPDAEGFLELVQQVLSRDIRSVHQRRRLPAAPSNTAPDGRSHGRSDSTGSSNSSITNNSLSNASRRTSAAASIAGSAAVAGTGGSTAALEEGGRAALQEGATAALQEGATAGSTLSTSGSRGSHVAVASAGAAAASAEGRMVAGLQAAPLPLTCDDEASGSQGGCAAAASAETGAQDVAAVEGALRGVATAQEGRAVAAAGAEGGGQRAGRQHGVQLEPAVYGKGSGQGGTPTQPGAAGEEAGAGGTAQQYHAVPGAVEVVYHVVLDGVDVQYRVRGSDGVVEVLGAAVAAGKA